MKFEIKNRWTGNIIFSIETDTWKLAVEAAIKSSANLSSANLSYADLSSADLSYANLRSANLRSANLRSADLRSADLSYANLSYADLSSADLSYANLRSANLRSANLSYADLSYANLRYADLSYANLSYADLSYANLSYAEGLNKNLCTPLMLLMEQIGNIRAYKLVTAEGYGPYNGGIKYDIGKDYVVEDANIDDREHCAAGINIATLDWCMRNWQTGYRILIAEFTREEIAAIPIATDGRFRVHRCKIVGEKDLTEIGLMKKEGPNVSG